jgi:transposase
MRNTLVIDRNQLPSMDEAALRGVVASLLEKIDHDAREISWRDTKIDKLTFEIAHLKRLKFGRQSEQMDTVQKALFDEAIEADMAALEQELQDLQRTVAPSAEKQKPKRAPLPAHLPRVDHHHEIENTVCACGCVLKRIGEDVSEKLDYTPGDFAVERHIRGKWVCSDCQTLVQAPVPPDVIDKGIPTAGLLAQVLVAKYADHLPLYRQEAIFGRAGLAIPRSTLANWVGACGARLQPLVDALKTELLKSAVLQADETPVSMLAPGTGKTHRSYLWSYVSGEFEPMRAVVYDFTPSRSGEHARTFLGPWQGSLVCDDFSGYKASFANGIVEIGCMAHARRKFVELHLANQSTLAATAIHYIGQLYGVEAAIKTLQPEQRLEQRRTQSAPIAAALYDWMKATRIRVTEGSAIAKAIDYSLNRWLALTRYLKDPALPIDNNHDERQIRPWATGRKNWLFAGTLLAGQRAAAIMSLIQSAKLNGHDPYAYVKNVLTRLPTQKASELDQLLPHRWSPAQ